MFVTSLGSFGCILCALSLDPSSCPAISCLVPPLEPHLLSRQLPADAIAPGSAAVEIVAVQEHAEQRGIRRQHHGRALPRQVPRRLHGTQERVEFGSPAQRVRIDARRLPVPLAAALLRELDRPREYPRLLLLRRGSHLQSLLLALRAVQHADAAAFGLHSGVEAGPVLLRKIEAAQLDIEDSDAVVPQRHGVTPTSNLGDDDARSVGCGIHRDKRDQTIAPDSGPQLCRQDVAEPRFGAPSVDYSFKIPLRIGSPPQDRSGCYDWRFLKGQEFARRRSVDEQAMVERPDALQGMLEPEARRSDHLCRLAEIRDDCVVRAVNGEKAKATDCSDQAKGSDRRQGAPIRPSVGQHCVIARSNHGPSVPLVNSSVGLFASARRHRGGSLDMIRIRKCAPMPHRGQETVIRVLRLWRWRDILRRTRPTRVYPYCARNVSRTYRLLWSAPRGTMLARR